MNTFAKNFAKVNTTLESESGDGGSDGAEVVHLPFDARFVKN